MKRSIVLLLSCIILSFQSCYIEDSTPCIPIVDYSTQRFYYNYPYPPAIEVFFYERCENYGTRFYLLVQDNVYGTEWINGRLWRYASGGYRFSPIVAYADFTSLAPNRTYRSIIISDYGTLSEEFLLYTF